MTKSNSTALEQALKSLEDGLAEYEQYPQLLTCRDGCIQRFEVAIDLSWKLMQRVLKNSFDLDQDTIRTKKDLFRDSEKYGLVASAEEWLEQYACRNQTSHNYDAKAAEEVFNAAKKFPPIAHDFLKRLANVD